MLFVPSTLSGQLGEVLSKVGSKSTLVITEQPGLGAKGSDVNFIMKDGKLAFELNQTALTKHKLKASSELTRLAILI
jgi:YfiR/HmsC-like